MDSPILITGCPRSGSSRIAAVIHACGAFGGVMAEENQSLERGMFENILIKETLNIPFLQELKVDPAGQFPLPYINNLSIPVEWKERVEFILTKEGYKGGKWFYKDSRSALIWPVWNYAFPNAKWIIVRRRTGDVISSCVKTGFMKAFKNSKNQELAGVKTEEEGWLWMVHEYEKKFVEMITAGLNCRVIWPQRMESGDYSQLYETIEWLGLKWNNKSFNYIDPLLKGKKGGNHGKSNS